MRSVGTFIRVAFGVTVWAVIVGFGIARRLGGRGSGYWNERAELFFLTPICAKEVDESFLPFGLGIRLFGKNLFFSVA
jgi:hypothetical protein